MEEEFEANMKIFQQKEQPCTKADINLVDDIEIDRDLENLIAEQLKDMLERRIIIVNDIQQNYARPQRTPSSFKLLHDCLLPLGLDVSRRNRSSKRVKSSSRGVDYMNRAVECSVDSDWVMSTVNTKFWKDCRKQRLLRLSAVGRWSNGAIECEVIK